MVFKIDTMWIDKQKTRVERVFCLFIFAKMKIVGISILFILFIMFVRTMRR